MIQNGITNFVSLLDNIMVGQVGTEQMSGVAIANQLVLIFNLLTSLAQDITLPKLPAIVAGVVSTLP